MASHKEISKLVTDLNFTIGMGRPPRNSQGICDPTFQPTPASTTSVAETPVNIKAAPHMPVTTPWAIGNNSAVQHTSNSHSPISMPMATQDSEHQVKVLTPCTRQYGRFVDPQGRPLQPGSVIFCDDFSFIVSANGRIYNYTGGNMRHIYVADPGEQRYLVNEANRPCAIANILGSILRMLTGFHNRQTGSMCNPSESNEQVSTMPEAPTIETVSTISSNSIVHGDGNAESKGNSIHNSTVETNIVNENYDDPDAANFHESKCQQDDAQNNHS